MADRHRENEESNEALDPELLYSKEYCIGEIRHTESFASSNTNPVAQQVVVVLAKSSKGSFTPTSNRPIQAFLEHVQAASSV